MRLSAADSLVLRRYVYQVAGIDLGEDKSYLVRQRLKPILVRRGLADFSELSRHVLQQPSPALRDEIISAISTNETSFFRDERVFSAFRAHILPWMEELVSRRRGGTLLSTTSLASILLLGVSTGQEGWSVAMALHEYSRGLVGGGLSPRDVRISALDISRAALKTAEAGVYSDREVARGVSDQLRDRYFEAIEGSWRVRPMLREMVSYRHANLSDPATSLGQHDIVFCRNLLIYFDESTKRRVLERIYEALAPGGFLVLGATESLYGLTSGFRSEHLDGAVFYRRV